jgi:hypothetical protein
MNTNPLVRVGLALLSCVLVGGCASSSVSKMVRKGDNTYTMTREAGNAFERNTEHLKALVREDAAKFCARQGRELKVIDLTTDKPFFSTGYAKATIVFKALKPGEVDQAAARTAVADAGAITSADELYAELTKLDELRKKGILTDQEFQSEKQKVLNRSK